MSMLFLITSLLLSTNSFFKVAAVDVEGTAITTRYFDCCLPSCSYPSKASYSSYLKSIKKDGSAGNENGPSGCISTANDASFTDVNQVPFAVDDNTAMGFVATSPLNGKSEMDLCCSCLLLTFTDGAAKDKTMTVQITNTGVDLQASGHIDIAMPGGGAGIYKDGCPNQYGNNYDFGAQYGGVSDRNACNNLPDEQQDGCYWRFDWFNNADNPSVSYKSVECPEALTNISKCIRSDAGNAASQPTPSPATDDKPTTPSPTTSKINKPTTPSPATNDKPTNNDCQKEWMQCGGINYNGNDCCDQSLQCVYDNDYWSSCQYVNKNDCTNSRYQQCGGKNYEGLTCCPSEYTCTELNEYYSQCI